MLDYNPRVKSAFVDYLYRSRGNERIPIREFAFEMDQRLFLLAHAQSLFQRALAQGLLLLSEDDGLARLGYRSLGDYSLERLGMSPRQAQQLRAVATGLKELPCLDAAWASGEVKYCVVRLLAGRIPRVEDPLWAEVGKRKTENQVRNLLDYWNDLKEKGLECEDWRRHAQQFAAEEQAQGKTERKPGNSGQSRGNRGKSRARRGTRPVVEAPSGEGAPTSEEGPASEGASTCEKGGASEKASTCEGGRASGRAPDCEGEGASREASAAEAGGEVDDDDDCGGRWLKCNVVADAATRWYVALEVLRRQEGRDVSSSVLIQAAVEEFMAAEGTDALARAEAEWLAHDASLRQASEQNAESTLAVAAATLAGGVGLALAQVGAWAGTGIRGAEWALDPRLQALLDDPDRREERERTWRDIEDDIAAINEHWAHLSWSVPHLRLPSRLAWSPGRMEPSEIDSRLRELMRLSQRNQHHLLDLLSDLCRSALYVDLEFTGLRHYAQERLGLSSSWCRMGVSLVRRLRRDPIVDKAFRQGQLNQEQARLISRVTSYGFEEAWIEHARSTTVRFLKEDVEAAQELRETHPEEFDRTGGLPGSSPELKVGGVASQQGAHPQGRSADPTCPNRTQEEAFLQRAAEGVAQRNTGGTGAPAPVLPAVLAGIADQWGMRADGAEDGQTRAPGVPAGGADDGQIRAPEMPAGGADDGQIRAPGMPTGGAHDGQIRAPHLSFREKLKAIVNAFARGESTEHLWPRSYIRLRFWLPGTLEDAWREAWRAYAVQHGPLHEQVDLGAFVSTLTNAYLQKWAQDALASIRTHPLIEAGGWKCSVPNCTNRACLEGHHIRFLSQGGSNLPENITPLCWFHHHKGVHAGRIVLSGTSPNGLVWRIGVNEDGEHLLVIGRRIVETETADGSTRDTGPLARAA